MTLFELQTEELYLPMFIAASQNEEYSSCYLINISLLLRNAFSLMIISTI